MIVTLAWTFNPFYNLLILQVIWAIGISMVILGLLVWLPDRISFCFAVLLIICFHNMLDYAELSRSGHVSLIWEFAHHGNFRLEHPDGKPFRDHRLCFLTLDRHYADGLWTGQDFHPAFLWLRKGRSALYGLGAACILLFIILRFLNQYGDPSSLERSAELIVFLFFFY